MLIAIPVVFWNETLGDVASLQRTNHSVKRNDLGTTCVRSCRSVAYVTSVRGGCGKMLGDDWFIRTASVHDEEQAIINETCSDIHTGTLMVQL